jgi:SAM-dependent methyltransferase
MKIEKQLELPEKARAYERYDPQTLEPLNGETNTRLQELGWSAQDFTGRTVLDIGSSSGLLTMYALRLGAAKVDACDVQPAFVEFVSSVVQAQGLPVTVSGINFDKLCPAERKADIVLFMELLHWVVSQGLELRKVISRLAELTEQILYIEFPWSVTEPSIQKQTQLTEETYSTDAVLDELTKYFRDVRIVRFMRYMGFGSRSKRVLIEARGKRPEASILGQLPGTYSLDVALSHGCNESYLLTSARGPLVAKRLAPESALLRIPEPLCNRLFDEIRRNQPKTILPPEKYNDSYLLRLPGGKFWMVFPFVGRLPSTGEAKSPSTDLEQLIDLFIKVRRDLRNVSPDLLKSLREHRFFTDVSSIALPSSAWAIDPGELAEIKDEMLQALSELTNLELEMFDGLCHGDLHTDNFVLDETDEPRVVDLDNFCVGPIYSDGLMGLIRRGAPKETLAAFCKKLGPEESRAATRDDVTLAIAKGIAWFCAARRAKWYLVMQEQVRRLQTGLMEAIKFKGSLA